MRAQTLAEVVSQGHGIERPFLCPIHQDSRPSASVNVLKNLWVCYTCGARGKVGGDALLGDVDFRSLKRHISQTLATDRVYPEAWLAQYGPDKPHEYWLGRLEADTCRHFRLGFDYLAGTPVYPLRAPSGDILGVVRRNLVDMPKYKYPMGIDIGKLLFNYHEAVPNAPLVLVEGAVDAMALWEAGVNVVAIYGSRFSDEQLQLIHQLSPSSIHLAFDMDTAGWSAAGKVRWRTKGYRTERVTWPSRFKDPADMPLHIRQEIFDQAVA